MPRGVFLFKGMMYFNEMNDLLNLGPTKWNLFILPYERNDFIFGAIAHVAIENHVTVLDCGRQYDATVVARKARGRKEITDKIKTQRAFTCHAVTLLLDKAAEEMKPVFVLNLLATFQDENVKLSTRKYLLEKVIGSFRKISRTTHLFVTTTPSPPITSDIYPLYKRLILSAPQIYAHKTFTPKPRQMGLPSWEI